MRHRQRPASPPPPARSQPSRWQGLPAGGGLPPTSLPQLQVAPWLQAPSHATAPPPPASLPLLREVLERAPPLVAPASWEIRVAVWLASLDSRSTAESLQSLSAHGAGAGNFVLVDDSMAPVLSERVRASSSIDTSLRSRWSTQSSLHGLPHGGLDEMATPHRTGRPTLEAVVESARSDGSVEAQPAESPVHIVSPADGGAEAWARITPFLGSWRTVRTEAYDGFLRLYNMSWAVRKIAEKIRPEPTWFVSEDVLYCRTVCPGASTILKRFEEGASVFEDPNLGCTWQVSGILAQRRECACAFECLRSPVIALSTALAPIWHPQPQ